MLSWSGMNEPRTLTWLPMEQMEPPLLGGRYLHCPYCTRRWRRRKKALTLYRRHYHRRHAR
jgi:hypothetical protein